MNVYFAVLANLAIGLLIGCCAYQASVIRLQRSRLREANAIAARACERTKTAVRLWLRLARAINPRHPGVERVARLLAEVEVSDLVTRAATGDFRA